MRMSNELEQIMKRRLKKSETNNNDNQEVDRCYTTATNSTDSNNDDDDDIHTTTTVATKNNQHTSSEYPHIHLEGKERLYHVIQCLERSCPWTKSVSSKEMLGWLRSELDELEKEIHDYDATVSFISIDHIVKNETTASHIDEDGDSLKIMKLQQQQHSLRQSVIAEMGDILFDTLMLDMMIRRDYNLEDNVTWNTASQKIERRTPYIKEWGDGSIATTAQEAEIIWQQVKEKEKRNKLLSGDDEHESTKNNSIAPANMIGKERSPSGDDVVSSECKLQQVFKGVNSTKHGSRFLIQLTHMLSMHTANSIPSVTLGFVAGTIFMAILQKLHQKP